jgi:ribosomal protein S27E
MARWRRRTWIQEERRKTLGDWVAFCLRCGHTQRYFLEDEAGLQAACPTCGGPLRHRCPACGAPIASAFEVECEQCGEALRDQELFGTPIRRPGR